MKIIIKESQEAKELNLIDPETNTNWIGDFVGNTGALEDGQFVYDEETDVYAADWDTYLWWEEVVAAHQDLDDRIHELKQKHGSNAVSKAIGDAGDCDLEDRAAAINGALDETFGAAAGE
jgi:hypothetical protein